MLSRYLEANGMTQLRARLLDTLNREIDPSGRDLMIGPSYFMKQDADSDDGLYRIWKYELLPLLEEHYYGRLERAQVHAQFGLDAILRRASLPAGESGDPTQG
jgi:5-methylcytosine-specific restriction protein B